MAKRKSAIRGIRKTDVLGASITALGESSTCYSRYQSGETLKEFIKRTTERVLKRCPAAHITFFNHTQGGILERIYVESKES